MRNPTGQGPLCLLLFIQTYPIDTAFLTCDHIWSNSRSLRFGNSFPNLKMMVTWLLGYFSALHCTTAVQIFDRFSMVTIRVPLGCSLSSIQPQALVSRSHTAAGAVSLLAPVSLLHPAAGTGVSLHLGPREGERPTDTGNCVIGTHCTDGTY